MDSSPNKVKRYNLAIPEELFNEVQRIADQRQTTVVELLRKFIRLGLIAIQAEENPDMALIIREGDKEREIMFL